MTPRRYGPLAYLPITRSTKLTWVSAAAAGGGRSRAPRRQPVEKSAGWRMV